MPASARCPLRPTPLVEVALWVDVDEQDALTAEGERRGQVDGRGGFADAAFLIGDRQDPGRAQVCYRSFNQCRWERAPHRKDSPIVASTGIRDYVSRGTLGPTDCFSSTTSRLLSDSTSGYVALQESGGVSVLMGLVLRTHETGKPVRLA